MSIIAPALRRNRWSYIALAGTLALLALIGALALKNQRAGSSSPVDPGATVAAPGIEQPAWDMRTFPAGTVGKPTKAQVDAVAAESDSVQGMVRDVYDALWLKPGTLDQVMAGSFEPAAAKAIKAARVGLPQGAADVQIVKRKASIGIDATGAKTAAARVIVVAQGESKKGSWKMHHAANLWLQRQGNAWKVIAFDYKQGPAR